MFDFKKEFKNLYQPKPTPAVVDVPRIVAIAVDGMGDPNTSAAYQQAVEVLYGLSYAIKMGNKATLEYVVAPLEGFWCVGDDFMGAGPIPDKSKFGWTAFIRQPDFVTAEVFADAKAVLAKKKPGLDTSGARLESFTEGLCVQALHIGPYDDEPATIAMLDEYALANGYVVDINDQRRHHEIYLSDLRKSAPEKLRTVLRHPIRAATRS
jgi:hypothetical protein